MQAIYFNQSREFQTLEREIERLEPKWDDQRHPYYVAYKSDHVMLRINSVRTIKEWSHEEFLAAAGRLDELIGTEVAIDLIRHGAGG